MQNWSEIKAKFGWKKRSYKQSSNVRLCAVLFSFCAGVDLLIRNFFHYYCCKRTNRFSFFSPLLPKLTLKLSEFENRWNSTHDAFFMICLRFYHDYDESCPENTRNCYLILATSESTENKHWCKNWCCESDSMWKCFIYLILPIRVNNQSRHITIYYYLNVQHISFSCLMIYD